MSSLPRGWVVAVRSRLNTGITKYLYGPWRPAFDGAVFYNKDMAERKADFVREQRIDGQQVRVLREGLVK